MKLEEFDYNLPLELIAQTPLPNRSDSKLLVVDVPSKTCSHDRFQNLTDYLVKGDVLVLNDTSVIPARIIGTKVDTGAIIELLLLQDHGDNVWECLAKKARKIKVGTTITFGDGMLLATCTKVEPDGLRWFQLSYDGILFEILDQLGEMPLPPYIHETLDDPSRYQTVYNKHKGSAAAPTAGLHFTNELLDQLDRKGVIITYVTLHVGLGTFRPVQVEDIRDHQMHTEWYRMSKETAEILNNAVTKQQRIIAVGTTSLRTLETVRRDYDTFVETTGWSDIFIYPGYEFKAIDNLITNFHLPKSTLLMLVSALAGKSLIMDAYQTAIEHHYRFFSFGDSMMIQRKK